MEATNEAGKNPAGAQSSAIGATLSVGLADVEIILNNLLDPMKPPEMRRDNNWHLIPTVNVKVEVLKKMLEIVRSANAEVSGAGTASAGLPG